MNDLRAVRTSILRLRADAEARGRLDLAIVYGWSAIQLGLEVLEALDAEVAAAVQRFPPPP